MIKIIIHGCNGRMGQAIASIAAMESDTQIVAGIDKFPDVRENSFPVYKSLEECNESADIIIDFSVPAALPDLLDQAVKRNIPIIIATTGFLTPDLDLITQASHHIPIFRSANMSLGVNVMLELAEKAASVLGHQFDIEIIENHHNQKVDSPSGTAYALADAINETLLNSKSYIYGRHSKNDKRSKAEIGIHAIRGGTVPGEHTVLFAGNDEVLEIAHRAYSRHIFAVGALEACKFLVGKLPGLYGMKDMLREQSIVTNISSKIEDAMVTLNNVPDDTGVVAQILQSIAHENINIDMISQTTPLDGKLNISFTLPQKDLDKAIETINDLQASMPTIHINIYDQIVKLSVEGMGMASQPGVAARIFGSMAKQDIRIKAITTSETKISYIIHQRDEKKALEALVDEFGL